jgi:two-component system OmpR family response regulator
MSAPKVLVVDDDESVLHLVRRTLEHEGWTVTTSKTPFGVVGLIEQHDPDVLVLDLMMPGLDGEAVSQFAGRLSDRPPVVFYSAADEDQLQALTRRTLDARYVRKGSPLDELVDAVREAAERGKPRAT